MKKLLIVLSLLLLAIPVAAQSDCQNGLPCGVAPWRLPIFPALRSPTPFPTVLVTAVPPTATPSPTVATNTPTITPTTIYCATPGSPTSIPYSTRVLSYAPDIYWPLTESAGVVAVDATGNGRHATYSGVTLGGETFLNGDRAPSFDGVNDFVNIFSAINGTYSGATGTVAGWAKANAAVWTDAANNRILNIQATSSFWISSISGGNNLYFQHISTTSNTTNPGTNWFHWAVTWSTTLNSTVFYVNGLPIGSGTTGTWSGSLSNSTNVLGASNTAGSAPWNGSISHVALWSTALDSGAIADLANMSAPAPTPTPIPGCSPFVPTATATTQFDVSGLNNQIATMSAIMNATPVPAPTAIGADPGAYAGQAFGFLIGIQNIHFGVFTPLIQFAFFALFTFIGLRVTFFIIPVVAAFVGIIRKIVNTILDFIPG